LFGGDVGSSPVLLEDLVAVSPGIVDHNYRAALNLTMNTLDCTAVGDHFPLGKVVDQLARMLARGGGGGIQAVWTPIVSGQDMNAAGRTFISSGLRDRTSRTTRYS
jgi:hypothetical protein